MSGTNHTTIIQKLQNWADNNPSDLIFVLCVGGGITVFFCIFFFICVYFIAKKTIIYEKLVNSKQTEENEK